MKSHVAGMSRLGAMNPKHGSHVPPNGDLCLTAAVESDGLLFLAVAVAPSGSGSLLPGMQAGKQCDPLISTSTSPFMTVNPRSMHN
jgi:hypothetical protein